VTRGEREYPGTSGSTDDSADTGSFVFGLGGDAEPFSEPEASSRSERRSRERRARQGRSRTLWALIAASAVIVIVGAALLIPKVVHHYAQATNYRGSGSGSVTVTIPSGADGSAMATILVGKHVVASAQAFTDAFSANPNADRIQPGSYNLKKHMSGQSAVTALLDPATRNADADVVVTEGATVLDVEARLEKFLGPSQKAAILAAAKNATALGLPSNYGNLPNSAEGFLFPATYTFDPGTTAAAALQQMVLRYIQEDRTTGFAAAAKKINVTPYDALIIASIAQAEAIYPADMAKVARVIYNRLAAGMSLEIDATSAYAGKLAGLDPSKVIYAQIDSPYNTYTHSGLPPTPIGNPGDEAMTAAVNPTRGDWLYYVNADKAGHLFFTSSNAAFNTAVAKCRANNWGCG
jgi:UPF0755 protein